MYQENFKIRTVYLYIHIVIVIEFAIIMLKLKPKKLSTRVVNGSFRRNVYTCSLHLMQARQGKMLYGATSVTVST